MDHSEGLQSSGGRVVRMRSESLRASYSEVDEGRVRSELGEIEQKNLPRCTTADVESSSQTLALPFDERTVDIKSRIAAAGPHGRREQMACGGR